MHLINNETGNKSMLKIFMVGIGGFTGAVSRYFVYEAALFFNTGAGLPIGTLVVNILGCLIIGFLGGLTQAHDIFSPEIRAFVFIGFLGGFTTFSTFGYEIFSLIKNDQTGLAMANMGLQIILGLFMVWAGFSLAKLA
jgi:CrcB protein